MAYCGYVVTLKEKFPHPNADRLVLAKIFGTQCIISNDYEVGKKYVFFPADGQLSMEYCEANNLIRKTDENGNNVGGYLEADKRNIKTIRLRKEASEGLLLPIESLAVFGDISTLKDGDTIDTFNGVEICKKYIPRRNPNTMRHHGSHGRQNHQKSANIKYNFPQHIDTPQLRFCMDKFEVGDLITVTEKLEGTSGRSAILPVKYKNPWWRRVLHMPEKMEWRDFCGTRRVTIAGEEEEVEVKPGFYGTHDFRMDIHNRLKPHLQKNMEVFYEIVGWTGKEGSPIMGEVDTTCLQDKEFTKKYGKSMIFHYGCEPGAYDFYIYRIALLDDDGDVALEYSTDQIAVWCEKHGFKMVPLLWRGILHNMTDAATQMEDIAHDWCNGESTLAAHWREGCVIRRESNAYKYDVFKAKNDYYKIMKGLFVEKLTGENLDNDILEEM